MIDADHLRQADLIVGLFQLGQIQTLRKRIGLPNEFVAWQRPVEELLIRRSLDDTLATVPVQIATVRITTEADFTALLAACRGPAASAIVGRLYPVAEAARMIDNHPGVGDNAGVGSGLVTPDDSCNSDCG